MSFLSILLLNHVQFCPYNNKNMPQWQFQPFLSFSVWSGNGSYSIICFCTFDFFFVLFNWKWNETVTKFDNKKAHFLNKHIVQQSPIAQC